MGCRLASLRAAQRVPQGHGLRLAKAGAGRLWRGRPAPAADGYAVTACCRSLLVTWMLRGLAASRTGMVRVSTPAA